MSKSNPLSFRIERETKEALKKAARDDHRSVSSLVELILKHWLVEHDYLSDNKFLPRQSTFVVHDGASTNTRR